MLDPDLRVILFLIDGLRADAISKTPTPVIDGLMRQGASTLSATSLMPNCTLPCHMSIFFGVEPERHGIVTNGFTPFVRPVKGLIELITSAGGACAMFYNWENLRDLSPPGTLRASVFEKMGEDLCTADRAVAAWASAWLANNPWNFAFVYLGALDEIGHKHGWMSEEYLQALTAADRCIGAVVPACGEGATVLVTADHGGHGKTHGTDCPEDMLIPFIAAGPQIPPGTKIATPFSLTDFAPTIVRPLGLAPDAQWIGTAARYE